MTRAPAVLFVCLGNICRSPLAEAAFRDKASRRGLSVEADSAGTGDWHVGEPPDPRARALAQAKGLPIEHYRARQLAAEDFHRFTHIVALDLQNLAGIRAAAPADSPAHVSLLLDWIENREGEEVADPYFGEEEGFEVTWDDVTEAARALADRLANGREPPSR